MRTEISDVKNVTVTAGRDGPALTFRDAHGAESAVFLTDSVWLQLSEIVRDHDISDLVDHWHRPMAL